MRSIVARSSARPQGRETLQGLRMRRQAGSLEPGLAAAKARGVQLGSYGKVLAQQHAAAAAERDVALRPVFEELAGLSARAIADELNRRKVPTLRGGPWHAMTVIRVQRRLGASS